MSRFIEKIKKQSETSPVSIGFRRATQSETVPKILLVAGVTIDDTASPLKNIDGADAVLLYGGNNKLNAKTLAKITKPLSDTPWGIYLDESDDTSPALTDAGCDFVILSPTSPVATVPQDEKIGKILEVDSAMDDGLLRAVNDLPADGVVATDTFGENNQLLWHHLMILRNLALLVRKPLIVPVPAAVTSLELKALWDAGIEAVVVPVDIAKGENLKKLHDAAAKLPPRTALKHGKVDVFLPRPGERSEQPPPDEEEEPE